MTEVLSLENVQVRRNHTNILQNVSWTVQEGERWVILGPNGAGKSTILEIAAGRWFPTAGTVRILGETLGKVDVFELRPRIGVASASLARNIPRHESALNVVVTAAYGILGRWRETYDEVDTLHARALLEWLDIADIAEQTFSTLSEGERKRVLIARALMTDPELLLLDEPAAGLDLGARELLVQQLERFAATDWAPVPILITHHVEEIPAGYTHVLLLHEGQVVAAGPISEALTPENLTTTFGLPLELIEHKGRYSSRAVFDIPRHSAEN